jgi:paraquat-inducible protein B
VGEFEEDSGINRIENNFSTHLVKCLIQFWNASAVEITIDTKWEEEKETIKALIEGTFYLTRLCRD